MSEKFSHLHLHTDYSRLDGVGKAKEYIDKAIELNMDSIAFTDHGNMFVAREAYKICKDYKAKGKIIKPITGIETYIQNMDLVFASPEEKKLNKNKDNFHLVLLPKNELGYKELVKLSSIAVRDNFYRKPRMTKPLLSNFGKNLIALSACTKGEIPFYLLNGETEKAYEITEQYIKIFGKDNFYIELQAIDYSEQPKANELLIKLASDLGLKTVATNDVHYVGKNDYEVQEIMLLLNHGKKRGESSFTINTKDLYFKNFDEMNNGRVPLDSILNTNEIAERCDPFAIEAKVKFPTFIIEQPECKNLSIEEYFKQLVEKGLVERYGDPVPNNIREKIDFEISTINKMGFPAYFVVVWDIIRFCRENNIPVGPGRGSAVGSIVAYVLKITELEPTKYNLFFERFLNPERVSMPDIDIDICQARRQEVIEYVTNKYGQNRVAQIITFGTMKAKNSIRDVGRVMNVPLFETERIAKLLDPKLTIEQNFKLSQHAYEHWRKTKDKSYEEILNEKQKLGLGETEAKEEYNLGQKGLNEKEFYELYITRDDIKEMVDMAKRIEGRNRNPSTHAAGIVISHDPLEDLVPLYVDQEKRTIVTGYQMNELEEIGLLKIDLLGLRNLTFMQETVELINERNNINLSLNDIYRKLEDKKSYEIMQKGDTKGLFQLESSGIKSLVKKIKPETFESIIAILALYRPGPLNSGMVDDFISIRNGDKEATYIHPLMKEALEGTYGLMVYQEQIMQVVQKLGLFSMGKSDILRRAIGKKKIKDINSAKIQFISGCLNNENFLKFTDTKVARETIARLESKVLINGEEKYIPSIEAFSLYMKENTIDEAKKDSALIAFTVFTLIEKFGDYGFNKSHSAGYALITLASAYLKTNYTIEFYTALLNSINEVDKLGEYIHDMRKHKILMNVPDINKSGTHFEIDENCIRFGFSKIKDIGINISEEIVEEKNDNGKYKELWNFISRIKNKGNLSIKQIQTLVMAGAFDCFEGTRKSKFAAVEKYIEVIKKQVKEEAVELKKQENKIKKEEEIKKSGQMFLFEISDVELENNDLELEKESNILLKSISIENKNEYSSAEILEKEKELLGNYISGYYLDAYKDKIDKLDNKNSIQDLFDEYLEDKSPKKEYEEESMDEYVNIKIKQEVNQPVKIPVIVIESKITTNDKGTRVNLLLQDMTGEIKGVIWNQTYVKIANNIPQKGDAVVIAGLLKEDKFGNSLQIFVNNIFNLKTTDVKIINDYKIYVKAKTEITKENNISHVASEEFKKKKEETEVQYKNNGSIIYKNAIKTLEKIKRIKLKINSTNLEKKEAIKQFIKQNPGDAEIVILDEEKSIETLMANIKINGDSYIIEKLRQIAGLDNINVVHEN